jgi:hypothetical protein
VAEARNRPLAVRYAVRLATPATAPATHGASAGDGRGVSGTTGCLHALLSGACAERVAALPGTDSIPLTCSAHRRWLEAPCCRPEGRRA